MTQVEYLKKLALGIGVIGGIGTYIMINSVPYLLNKQIKKSEVYQEAMKLIKNHSEALKYLGEPIEEGFIIVTKRELYGHDDEKSWFTVPVKGPKSSGNLYCESVYKKDKEEGKVVSAELSRLELTVKSLPGYKLLIKRPD